jgi:hypothetical protein
MVLILSDRLSFMQNQVEMAWFIYFSSTAHNW